MTETITDPEREAVRGAIEEQQAAAEKALEAERKATEARSKAAAASQAVDALAREREARWAERVVASYPADSAATKQRQTAEWAAFQDAASTGSADPLPPYLKWFAAGTEQNRLATRYRLARGQGTGHPPPFGNAVSYLMALESAVSGATHRLLGETDGLALAEWRSVQEGMRPEDDGLAHLEGCPGGRIETFTSDHVGKAALPNDYLPSSRPHVPVQVTRCLWCGAERVDTAS
ncbi:hypothetical protein BH20CHL6_BH20CHL6_10260 [soil metagenome]